MSSHGDRFRPRPGLIPAAFKFPTFQGLCVGGLDSSAYLASTMASPALMVLASTAADNQCQRTYSAGQVLDKESPFSTTSFSGRPMFSQTDSYPAPLLPVHYPHGLDRQVGFLNPTPGGAFRPLSMSDDRGFHGSAFVPTQCLKLEQATESQHLAISSCYHNSETTTFLSPPSSIGNTTSTISSLGHSKGECGQEKDVQDRLTDTPLSEAESNDGSILGDFSSLKKIKRKILVDGQIPFCPVCGITLRLPELSTHFQFEVERLTKISKNLSQSSEDGSTCNRTGSPAVCRRKEDEKPETRWETYQRVKSNRQNRLSARACNNKKKKMNDDVPCPVCNVPRLPMDMSEHMPICNRKNEENMDVESTDYDWSDSRRLNISEMNDKGQTNQDDDSQDLNVDCDDTATYGQPQYTEADVVSAEREEEREVNKTTQKNGSTANDLSTWNNNEAQEISSTTAATDQRTSDCEDIKVNCTEIDLQKIDETLRCFVCMEMYTKPVVSVCCWHVHCEECWLKTLGMKKLCPQCSGITGVRDLRRIYL
ncbi:E3 ubiquitin-protein ligase RNF220-like [Centruroides sculpturatus]|uniref:E3 ubiquitin-protein ligase RNF220-like n=1 Tax=Centruroides sculpturatus TaxID=218467 RepID=UPI000C6CA6EE|nr:E3 ubiquitin-protein ligase RNF220-like [Centruroides sculpturatus]